jgi:glyoxylase-like metal-dependent hydrolase (beta-lactamase superfamily II)
MKISNYIHVLKIPFFVKLPNGNSLERSVQMYILVGEQLALVDTGVAGSEKVIFEYIESIGRKPKEIKHILLTHTHPDHIGAVRAIKEATGAKVYVHTAEQAWVENIEKQFAERPVGGFHELVGGSCKVDQVLHDNDILHLCSNLTLKVIHSPGHSAGSVSYLLQQDNALFTGDAIPVKGDIPIYDDWTQSLSSLEKLENLPFPAFVLPAWDNPKTGEEAEEAFSHGFDVLYDVHQAFCTAKDAVGTNDMQALASNVVTQLNLSPQAMNPLFVRSLLSHVNIR